MQALVWRCVQIQIASAAPWVSTPWPRNWLSKDGRLMMILGGSHITSWRNTTAYRGSCRTANRLSMDFEHRFLLHCGAMICQAPVCPMNVQFHRCCRAIRPASVCSIAHGLLDEAEFLGNGPARCNMSRRSSGRGDNAHRKQGS